MIIYETQWNPLINQTQLVPTCSTTSSKLSLTRDILGELLRSIVSLILQVSSSVAYSRKHSNRFYDRTKRKRSSFCYNHLCSKCFLFCDTNTLAFVFYTGATKSSISTTEKQAVAFLIYKGTTGLAGFNYILVFFVNLISNRIYRVESVDLVKVLTENNRPNTHFLLMP